MGNNRFGRTFWDFLAENWIPSVVILVILVILGRIFIFSGVKIKAGDLEISSSESKNDTSRQNIETPKQTFKDEELEILIRQRQDLEKQFQTAADKTEQRIIKINIDVLNVKIANLKRSKDRQ